MHTGIFSSWVVWQVFFERYTRVLLVTSPKFPIHFLKIYGFGGVDEAFRQGLRDLGYIEGQNITIEYRHADNQRDRLPALAAELVRLPVDILVTAGENAARAAQQ